MKTLERLEEENLQLRMALKNLLDTVDGYRVFFENGPEDYSVKMAKIILEMTA